MRKAILGTVVTALAVGGMGCALRNAEMYEKDTRALLESRLGDVQTCYNGVVRGQPAAIGNVVVRFEVQEDSGKIIKVVVDEATSTAPQPVRDCVLQSMEGLVLNPPDNNPGMATFSYEFEVQG